MLYLCTRYLTTAVADDPQNIHPQQKLFIHNKNFLIQNNTFKVMQNANHALKLFLQEEYAFRRNLLSGKIEFCERKSAAGDTLVYHTLTREDLNSIVLAAEEALPGVKALRQRL